MFEIFNSPGIPGLVVNVLACVSSTLLLNGLIFGLGWSRLDRPALLDPTVAPRFTPPGYAFGLIWTGLFSLMGTARWLIAQGTDPTIVAQHQQLVLGLIIFCLVQPLYSTAISSRLGGILGTVAAFGLAGFTAVTVRSSSAAAGLLIVPVALWTLYASILLIAVIRSRGWQIPPASH
jgi:tryptophan-rich sensory protein